MDREERYTNLHSLVKTLTEKRDPALYDTEWWNTQYRTLQSYCFHFTEGFTDIHPEITNERFRSNCSVLDMQICDMMDSWEECGRFCLETYLLFNTLLIDTADFVLDRIDEENDFSLTFSRLKV